MTVICVTSWSAHTDAPLWRHSLTTLSHDVYSVGLSALVLIPRSQATARHRFYIMSTGDCWIILCKYENFYRVHWYTVQFDQEDVEEVNRFDVLGRGASGLRRKRQRTHVFLFNITCIHAIFNLTLSLYMYMCMPICLVSCPLTS